ncbi:hypothetical protein Tco_0618064 [Tanacetum coccineum]
MYVPATPSLGLVPNPPPLAPFVPTIDHEWDLVSKPVIDEYSLLQASVGHLQLLNKSFQLLTKEESHDLEVARMSKDSYFGIPIPETISEESSSSDVISTTVHLDAPIS